jgi:hypothetical protein
MYPYGHANDDEASEQSKNQSKSFISLNRFDKYFITGVSMVNTKHLISILVSLVSFGLKSRVLRN